MQIVGLHDARPGAGEIHTIDVWFSQRRNVWIVERLDADGTQIGHAHVCATREDADVCLAEWLRAHGEARLVGTPVTAHRKATRRAA